MQRAEAPDQPQDSRDQVFSFCVAKLAKCACAAQMVRAIGITARTLQGAFFGDFYRQKWLLATQNATPSWDEIPIPHSSFPFLPKEEDSFVGAFPISLLPPNALLFRLKVTGG
jgi:hypothetical protein